LASRWTSVAAVPIFSAMTDPVKALLRPLEEIEAELQASEAEAMRGETVPLDMVLDQIRASIARQAARRATSLVRSSKA
jgi:hypothetical protein